MNRAGSLCLTGSALVAFAMTAHGQVQPKPLPPLLWQLDRKPWNPPVGTLPEDYVKGAQRLLANGFGDPRGGEYRQIYSGLRIYHQDFPPKFPYELKLVLKETRGWYFPPKGGRPARAVLLDGITCEPAKVGQKEDLEADIRTALSYKYGRAWMERFDPNELKEPTAIMQLFLLGKNDDAKKLAEVEAKQPKYSPPSDLKELDARDAMESFWQTAGFYGSKSYVDGQDGLSYQTSTVCLHLESVYFDTINENSKNYPGISQEELVAEDRTIAEIERRLRYPEPSFDELKIAELKKPERIRRLIEALDTISIQKSGFHSQNDEDFIDAPVVRRLISEGNVAVDPILECIHNDNRLTRSYSFDGYSEVREAALAAFRGIIRFDNVIPGFDPYGYRAPTWDKDHFVPLLARTWARLKDLKPEDRYFHILSDDHATPAMWDEAAIRLVCPEDINLPLSGWGPGLSDFDKGDPERRLKYMMHKPGIEFNEPVSSQLAKYINKTPSLTEFLLRRANQLLQAPVIDKWEAMTGVTRAMRFARYVAAWDPKSALPILRAAGKTYGVLLKEFDQSKGGISTGSEPLWNLELRMKLNDETAWPAYVDELLTSDPNTLDPSYEALLEPLTSESSKPQAAAVLEKLFNGPESPWNPSNEDFRNIVMPRLVSPLLVLPQYQEAILRLLDDQSNVDTASYDGHTLHTGGGSRVGRPPPPFAPAIGEKRDIRKCDEVAHALCFAILGAPEFHDYWPQDKKDATLAQLKAFLRANSARMKDIIPIFNANGWRGRQKPGDR